MRRAAVAMVVALIAAPVLAVSLSDVDTDGDSLVSFTEMSVLYPGLTDELFAEIDKSDDSVVDETELTAGIEAGLIEELTE